ncbi:type I-E CRISPR-associated protein Cse1/CasA [Methylobacter luteus]|jgi:CRISPR system Cascade subunit CasA|uniref:type I-E CRISPR-associated protein Cse1/CasA n=1 Tax=Methylobacter luteus TaxID=415 RepID=UPI000401AAC2|nr:type I-E CRISPR-associated protein Cse1/CasA [Methylobacter luteus]
MTVENRFNLIDEPWIPVVDVGRVSLRDLFSRSDYRALGGNPVQKIALIKLLLSIAQSAATPADDEAWTDLGALGLSANCLAYLERWHDRFWLYGDQPFLQMPAIRTAGLQSFGAVLAEVATGNTTVLTQTQIEKSLSDADKALLIVSLMGFGLGGKKTDNSVVLSPGYTGKTNDKGKPATGKPGPAIGFMGFMHNFLIGRSVQETLWLNLLTVEQLQQMRIFSAGLGKAPWEAMPVGEACDMAKSLQASLIGRLLPLSRFCLLTETGLHYSEGIAHQGYKESMVDPSVSVDFSGKDPKVIWVDPEKRPWRFLPALLGFLAQTGNQGFDCYQLRFGLQRARSQVDTLGLWSGGLRVSSNAGEQFVSGSDDFVESMVMLPQQILGTLWYTNLQLEMFELDQLSKVVYSATLNYFKNQNMEGKAQAGLASNLFWQLCERKFQDLVNACEDFNQATALRKTFAGFANRAYDHFCAKDTARQFDAWAKNRPNLVKYLKDQTKTEEAQA